MLIAMVVILGLLVIACTLSKITTGRIVMQLEEELFQLIEEQRRALHQLQAMIAALKSVEARKDLAQKECVKLQNDLFKVQAQIRGLAETAEKRKGQEQSSRPF